MQSVYLNQYRIWKINFPSLKSETINGNFLLKNGLFEHPSPDSPAYPRLKSLQNLHFDQISIGWRGKVRLLIYSSC